MPKINLHIIAILLVIGGLFAFSLQFGEETFILFGFAENREMEIRLEHPASIQKIYATSGAKVQKGDLLFEVTRSELELSSHDLDYEVAKLGSELSAWQAEIQGTIAGLEALKYSKENEIKSQIEQLESEKALNESLMKDIKSIESFDNVFQESPLDIKLQGLRRELILSVRPLESQIQKLEDELAVSNNPMRIQIEKLNNKKAFVDTQKEQLQVFAIDDGIVGAINCKVGEQFPAFSTLMTFYRENPTQVKGYVMENLLMKVKKGDELEIQSTTHTGSEVCHGTIIGMGSRIVEIPERLRKIPDFKTYGREIIIRIPGDNDFLQNEKVVLRVPLEETSLMDQMLNAFRGEKEDKVYTELVDDKDEQ